MDRMLFLRSLVGFAVVVITCLTIYVITVAFLARPTAVRRGYLVNSTKCKIPDYDPWDWSISEHVRKVSPFVCSNLPPLTHTVLSEGRQELRIAQDAMSVYNVTSEDELQCCLSVLTRVDDYRNNRSACVEFGRRVALERSVEHVFVKCVRRANKKQVYANVHAVVQLPAAYETNVQALPGQRRLNVMLLGIDSMARNSLERSMPKTVAHLQSTGWLELQGYNKIGLNTFPNLFAVMTGLNMKQALEIDCYEKQEDCPFLWDDFKKKGYVTAYGEDTHLSTFNARRRLTDLYLKTMITEGKIKMPAPYSYFDKCMGGTRTTDIVLKYTLDLAKTFNDSLFSLTWICNFSHDSDNLPATEDRNFLKLFRDLDEVVARHDNTLFVFLSDHGLRFGPIRESIIGWFEECLPFIYFRLPAWFGKVYPEAFENLVKNKNRLTSPFDLYLTLKDVVDGTIGEPGVGCQGCQNCTSLFRPIKEDRSCAEAGIPDNYCTCSDRIEVSTTSAQIAAVAQFAVGQVNDHLSANDANINQKGHCAHLRVTEIWSAQRISVRSEDQGAYDDYAVAFRADPRDFWFDATVRCWFEETPRRFELLGRVIRTDEMQGEFCDWLTDKISQEFCFCLR